MRSSSTSTGAAAAAAAAASLSLVKNHVYVPPDWAINHFTKPPQQGRLNLANLPTPLYQPTTTTTTNVRTTTTTKSSSSPIMDMFSKLDITFLVKRDDMSGGVELGGNKVRKLEFLLADALQACDEDKTLCYDSIVTIGGEQSNHCRATACAARMVGLEPHLILRTKRANSVQYASTTTTTTTNAAVSGEGTTTESTTSKETNSLNDNESSSSSLFGTVGNILLDRMVGSSIYTCTPGEYGRLGSEALVSRLCTYLKDVHGRTPYAIPVGGSNAVGTWGYIEAIHELEQQMKDIHDDANDDDDDDNRLTIDHVVFACGSGGTAAGMALGLALCPYLQYPKVHAVGVCDDPNYFHHHVTSIAHDMGFVVPDHDNNNDHHDNDNVISQRETAAHDDKEAMLDFIKQSMTVHQGKGLGYAVSTPEELEFCIQFARETGVVLDPVYSGKALYHFCTHVLDESYRNCTILFWHTGGALGMYDKELDETLESYSSVQRLDVYGMKKDKGDGMVSI